MMGKFWLGVGILLLFLVLGFWVMASMDATQQQIAQTLETAAQQALSGDVRQGYGLAQEAQHRWQRRWHATAAVADHEPMDEIDSLFAQMEIYAQGGDTLEFAACCHRVAQLVRAVGEAHRLNWWNLL